MPNDLHSGEPRLSGLYAWSPADDPPPEPAAVPRGLYTSESLRLDVDGPLPLSALSGTTTAASGARIEWIARLVAAGEDRWSGSIWHKAGDAARFPFVDVDVRAEDGAAEGAEVGSADGAPRLVVRFRAGSAERVAAYVRRSAALRELELEIDAVDGASGVTSIALEAHPDRPSDLEIGMSNLERVFRAAGFALHWSGAVGGVPLANAGVNGTWSDAELHDAMQQYWSLAAIAGDGAGAAGLSPRWALWALFAARHDAGRKLGGLMFDGIGPRQRQGLALFTQGTIIDRPPVGDPAPAAWSARMKFFTLVHEIGHALNLAHSWEKSLGHSWLAVADEPDAASFLNYPQRTSGGEREFFRKFRYRFSDGELLFLRHAPENLVRTGEAAWFDDHAFRETDGGGPDGWRLELRNRPERPSFEFLEPIVLELKLANTLDRARSISAAVLLPSNAMTVLVRPRQGVTRRWRPFVRTCGTEEMATVPPGGALYGTLPIFAGLGGWELCTPGVHEVQVSLQLDGDDVVSNALRLKIAPPGARSEEILAQDFFEEDVGRALAFGGTAVLERANDTLREVSERFSPRNVAVHARLALASPLLADFKRFVRDARDGHPRGLALRVRAASAEASKTELDSALLGRRAKALRTLGHIAFHRAARCFCERLAEQGDGAGAAARLQKLLVALRGSVSSGGRPVAPAVLDSIRARIGELRSGSTAR